MSAVDRMSSVDRMSARRVSCNSAVSYNRRRISHNNVSFKNTIREDSVPHSIETQSSGNSDVSDLDEKNAHNDGVGVFLKQYQCWQQSNANKWNSSSDRERKNRLQACLYNVAVIDSTRQGHELPTRRQSQQPRPKNRRASRRRTETDMSMQRNHLNECNQKVRKVKNSERESIRESLTKEVTGGSSLKVVQKDGWVEPVIENEKPANKLLTSFIEKNVRSRAVKKGEVDHGAFSLWRISKAA